MIIERIAYEWLQQKRNYIKESTYAYYKVNIDNYIIPYFGDLEPSSITNSMMQDVVNYWQHRQDNEGYYMKWSTVKNILSLLKQILFFAQNEMGENVLLMDFNLHPIKNSYNTKRKVWTIQEQRNIVSSALKENSNRNLGILIAINCGLRIGEICALQWKDVDVKMGVIYIRKTLQRIYMPDETPKSRVIISSPKTFSSIREIPMSKDLISYICDLDDMIESHYVLTNAEYYMEPRSYRKYFKNFLKKYDIDNLNFHCLRHSFATRCITNGSDIKVVSDLLGHSTVNTTWNMYVHPSMPEKQKCVETASII
ncbi:MAG: site-specific integrase [Lachnospiraceae bacterium]|nr:site-specific integrase [Lachnospiraceae bacterium]